MKNRISPALLYGIVDFGYVAPERAAEVAKQLIAGGAGVLQLRAKKYDESSILEAARGLLRAARQAGRASGGSRHRTMRCPTWTSGPWR